jgi:hypothetical protein
MKNMDPPTKDDRRKYHRFETTIPIRFNLNPDFHFVPGIRKLGVGGKANNISIEGLLIDSRMDLLDVCQIFPEAMEDHSAFELEVALTDLRGRRELIRGAVRWYRLSKPKNDVRHFQAGLYLKDTESRAVAKGMVQSIAKLALT